MYCKKCGSQINDNATKCQYCGYIYGCQNNAYNYNANAYKKSTNEMAIVGFVMSFFMPIIGLICSILGYKQAHEYREDYRSLALAGIIISAIELGIFAISTVVGLLIAFLPLLFIF